MRNLFRNFLNSKNPCFGRNITFLIFSAHMIFSLYTLDKYPLHHIDEAWLSSIVDNYVEGNGWNTAPSTFRERPYSYMQYGNIFLGLQHLVFSIAGYSLVSARIPSLLSFIVFYWLFYFLLQRLKLGSSIIIPTMALIAVSRAILYSSHHARQEMLTLLFLLLAIHLFLETFSHRRSPGIRLLLSAATAIVTTLSLEVHMNGLIIGLAISVLFAHRLFFVKERYSFPVTATFVITSAAMIMLWFGIRYSVDPSFVKYYLEQGESSGTFSMLNRFDSLVNFIGKQTLSRPYQKNLPELFTASILAFSFIYAAVKRIHLESTILTVFICIWIGLILMNRFNGYYYVLVLPWSYCIISTVISKQRMHPLLGTLIVINAFSFTYYFSVNFFVNTSSFGKQLQHELQHMKDDESVLGEISYQYYLNDKNYIAFRDLVWYMDNIPGASIDNYMTKYKIRYIIRNKYLQKQCSSVYDEMINSVHDRIKKRNKIDSALGKNKEDIEILFLE